MSTQITVATINKYLKAAGHAERLARGKDYFYFHGGEAHTWPATSVYVAHVNQLSVADWVSERNELALAAERAGWANTRQVR